MFKCSIYLARAILTCDKAPKETGKVSTMATFNENTTPGKKMNLMTNSLFMSVARSRALYHSSCKYIHHWAAAATINVQAKWQFRLPVYVFHTLNTIRHNFRPPPIDNFINNKMLCTLVESKSASGFFFFFSFIHGIIFTKIFANAFYFCFIAQHTFRALKNKVKKKWKLFKTQTIYVKHRLIFFSFGTTFIIIIRISSQPKRGTHRTPTHAHIPSDRLFLHTICAYRRAYASETRPERGNAIHAPRCYTFTTEWLCAAEQ